MSKYGGVGTRRGEISGVLQDTYLQVHCLRTSAAKVASEAYSTILDVRYLLRYATESLQQAVILEICQGRLAVPISFFPMMIYG